MTQIWRITTDKSIHHFVYRIEAETLGADFLANGQAFYLHPIDLEQIDARSITDLLNATVDMTAAKIHRCREVRS